MIVLEGPDKGGKTTLAKKFKEKFPELVLTHFGIPKHDPTFDYSNLMEIQSYPSIVDRFFYGEKVYSRVKKRTTYMDWLALNILQFQMQSFPHLVIYCRPTREELFERHKEQPDNYIKEHEINELLDEYDALFAYDVWNNTAAYDGKNNFDIESWVEQILSEKRWAHFRNWKNFKWPGVGTLHPHILLVGERFNSNSPHQIVFWSQSGEYLLKCLEEANIKFKQCHMTNAVINFDNKLSHEYIAFLNPQIIIAFGNVAWEAVKTYKQGACQKLCKMPHPAYYTRFHASDRKEYVEELKACL